MILVFKLSHVLIKMKGKIASQSFIKIASRNNFGCDAMRLEALVKGCCKKQCQALFCGGSYLVEIMHISVQSMRDTNMPVFCTFYIDDHLAFT